MLKGVLLNFLNKNKLYYCTLFNVLKIGSNSFYKSIFYIFVLDAMSSPHGNILSNTSYSHDFLDKPFTLVESSSFSARYSLYTSKFKIVA
jgi:hypothetical protein